MFSHVFPFSLIFKEMIYQHNLPLNDKNWFKTGGTAHCYAEPRDEVAFKQALLDANTQGLPIFIMGEGANILISDAGFKGMVIRPQLTSFYVDQQASTIVAGAGISIADLINLCLAHNLIGLEEFSGIPGTVGGALYINLHYFSFLIEHFLLAARVIHKKTGLIQTVDRAWFCFGYNESRLQREDYFVVDATFQLKPATDLEVAYAKGRGHEIIRHRHRRYPRERTCGSFFRNFFPHEVAAQKDAVPYVGYYLDRAGVRGTLSYGGAAVSHLHANMIVTSPGATTDDVINLARLMQQRVYESFGLLPQPECRLIGFDEYPLLLIPHREEFCSGSRP